MSIDNITLSKEELKGLSIGETRRFDFSEAEEIPKTAYLKNPAGDIIGTACLSEKPFYFGRRIIASYKITSTK